MKLADALPAWDHAAKARFNKLPALEAMFSFSEMEKLNRIAPASFVTPLGHKIPIFYHDDKPEISLKLREMFGQKTHPTVAGKPLVVTLLSPAGRPLQTTTDVPGFWKTSYFDVRKTCVVDTQNIPGQKIRRKPCQAFAPSRKIIMEFS